MPGIIEPSVETPPMDIASTRNQLQRVHSALRDRGMGPSQALRHLADALAGEDGVPRHPDAVAVERLRAADPRGLAIGFQQFMADDARAGLGQYLTPPVVADHLAELIASVSPTAGVIVDPFLGTGILLDATLRRVAGASAFGVEINPDIAHVARASMRLGGHDRFTMVEGDAFAAWFRGSIPVADVVVTNPPFGTSTVGALAGQVAATKTALWLGAGQTVPVELLALELCMEVVRPGGHVAVVVPASVLTNRRWAGFRQGFFSTYRLLHVTQLPSATFKPFRGVARASVLLLENSTPPSDASFVYFEPTSVGYDDTGREDRPADLGSVLEREPAARPIAQLSPSGSVVRT